MNMMRKEYSVGDTITFTAELFSEDEITMGIVIYNGYGTIVYDKTTDELEEYDENKYLCVIPHDVTKRWKPGNYSIHAAVWTAEKGWMRSANTRLELVVNDSEIGRR